LNRIDLDGRVAVITGGAGGIGFAAAERMIASGARVALWDRDATSLAAARERLDQAIVRTVDVTSESAVANATADTLAECGKIDILINAAGITAPKVTILEASLAEWRRIFDINMMGTFLCSRAIARPMVQRDYGRIVNLGSVAGKEGNPFSAAYSASKAAVISFTKSLAKELAKTGVRVNCVTPAIIATRNLYYDMPEEMQRLWVSRVPMGRPGHPEEVAAMIAWLASEECSFTTGAAFDLSGGRATY
jgi:NAD(P)-dependent dehydrogenase (short-subunit alcohol dehydrogenase family)